MRIPVKMQNRGGLRCILQRKNFPNSQKGWKKPGSEAQNRPLRSRHVRSSIEGMKMTTRNKLTCATGTFAMVALTSIAAPPIVVAPPPPPVVAPPPVSVSAPPPVAGAPGVTVNIGVPDSYVWDGSEYVGVIGDQYYYLGPNQVWLPMAPSSPGYLRFHDWEKAHHDWLKHATRNEKYRMDAQGHEHPWHSH